MRERKKYNYARLGKAEKRNGVNCNTSRIMISSRYSLEEGVYPGDYLRKRIRKGDSSLGFEGSLFDNKRTIMGY